MTYSFFSKGTAFLLSLIFIFSCNNNQDPTDPNTATDDETHAVRLKLDLSQRYQTIDNFGASDAWSCQFVGLWPEGKKNAIADLLFSMETSPDGQPQGIGLSLWRFNIGAGSAEQGEASDIPDEWRRAESFMLANGQYNWEKQEGQQWFLQAAQERGVDYFLAFPNSPPVHMTTNGKAYAFNGKSNLDSEHYEAFASYLANVVEGIADHTGISFQYLSPVNEPQWDWSDANQEGTPFTNNEIAGIVRALNTELENRKLDISIDIAEAGKINYLYATDDKPQRGEQIKHFFDSNSANYLGNLSKVGNVISAHSYFTTSPAQEAIRMREELADELAGVPSLKYWMSEYCILGDNSGEIQGNSRDLGMEAALYLAEVIHRDLTIANASAWQWWLAISPYDYKDGLIYVDKNKSDGNFYESKMLWALGNYSRFIRPGAQRIGVSEENSKSHPLLVSSYIHPELEQSSTVIVNNSSGSFQLTLSFEDADIDSLQAYVTHAAASLTPTVSYSEEDEITIAPNSITTLVGKIR